jgi:hypothetical protein
MGQRGRGTRLGIVARSFLVAVHGLQQWQISCHQRREDRKRYVRLADTQFEWCRYRADLHQQRRRDEQLASEPNGMSPAVAVGADFRASAVTFKAFSEEQWETIRSLREDWPEDIDWLSLRREFELEGRVYWSMHERRKALGVPSKVRDRLKILLGQYRKLQDGLNSLPRPILHDLPVITPLEAWLQDQLILHENIAKMELHYFTGNSDYYREMLCDWLITQWVDTLGGELSFSRDQKDNEKPYGPLIDFLSISLTAIVGKAPGPSGLAKIIEAYR